LEKKIIGPILREMIGGTISIYSKTTFDCGEKTIILNNSIKII